MVKFTGTSKLALSGSHVISTFRLILQAQNKELCITTEHTCLKEEVSINHFHKHNTPSKSNEAMHVSMNFKQNAKSINSFISYFFYINLSMAPLNHYNGSYI